MNHNSFPRFTRGCGAFYRGRRGGKVGTAIDAEALPQAPLGRVVRQFPAPDLPYTVFTEKNLGIANVEIIASFNWLDKGDAHITVPGKYRYY